MTISIVCAVYDSAVQAFSRPIFVPSANAAIRSFVDEVDRAASDNTLYHHPGDFDLRLLCVFDDTTGVFRPDEGGVRVLARAKDVRESKE